MLSESEDVLVVADDRDGTFNKPSMGTLHLFASPYSAAETLNIEQQHLIYFFKPVMRQDVFRASFHKIWYTYFHFQTFGGSQNPQRSFNI